MSQDDGDNCDDYNKDVVDNNDCHDDNNDYIHVIW